MIVGLVLSVHLVVKGSMGSDRHSQVRWLIARGHDSPRRMGVAIAIHPFQVVYMCCKICKFRYTLHGRFGKHVCFFVKCQF